MQVNKIGGLGVQLHKLMRIDMLKAELGPYSLVYMLTKIGRQLLPCPFKPLIRESLPCYRRGRHNVQALREGGEKSAGIRKPCIRLRAPKQGAMSDGGVKPLSLMPNGELCGLPNLKSQLKRDTIMHIKRSCQDSNIPERR
jgi:hypothetical protein